LSNGVIEAIITAMYEIFEHTADLGLRIRADELSTLFEQAGRALLAAIVENDDDVRPAEEMAFEVEGHQHDELLLDWLGELLYCFHTRHILLVEFDVTLTDRGLTAQARGEPIDRRRHRIDAEIKAITYHVLKVDRDDAVCLAEVFVDI